MVWVSEKPQFGPYAGRVVASYYEPSLLLAVGPALAVGAYAFTHKSESALGLVGSITDLYPVDRELLFFDDFKAYPDGSKGEPFWSVVALNDTYGNRLMADFMIKSGWMIAGRAGTYQMGALLTGVKAREFKAEVEVELLDFDPKVSNYAYIVYAYKDADNYRSFQAHWNTNGRIYAIIGKVVAGKGYSAPAWPGLDTGVTFSKGSKVKIVGEVRGNTHTLTLIADGKPFKVSMADVSEEGLIGIGTARAYSQAFDNFKIYP